MKNNIHSLMKKALLLIIPAFFLYGCGVWADFTTYFNLYYNASDLFDSAEKAIKEQKQDIFAAKVAPIPGNASQTLNKVIEKCSKVLQFHNESDFVDDALLMLGKSFYYQRNYQKALRKFKELLATRPNSDLILETQLWVGKTQMRLRQYDDALTTLKDVRQKAIAEGEDEIIDDSYIEEIRYEIGQEDYNTAITSLQNFLKETGNDELGAEAAFELGKLYEDINDDSSAVTAFQKVFDFSPSYDTEFEAKIELGKALRESGQPEKALEVFDDMRSEDKYSDTFDEIDVQLGKTLNTLGKTDEAIDIFMRVDTTYSRKVTSGIAKYELGKIFEDKYHNLDSAAYYYASASRATAPPEIITEATKKDQLFKKYFSLRDELYSLKRKLVYAENPDEFVKDSINYQVELERLQMDAVDRNGSAVKDTSAVKDSAQIAADSLKQNQKDINNVPDRRQPVRPDNRRRDFAQNNNQNEEPKNPELEAFLRKPPPQRPTQPVDTLKKDVLRNEFELGNLFFTELDLPDSAYNYYLDILDNFSDSTFRAKTLYALGSFFEVKNENSKADSLYKVIYDNYRNESIVNAAAVKLDKPLINLDYDPADSLYKRAENVFMKNDFDSSLTEFSNIYKKYPKSPFAAKALYASGWILENKKDMLDSAAVVYDSLAARFPKSNYATKVLPKLKYYKEEQAKEKKRMEDSLKTIRALIDEYARKKEKPDSLKLAAVKDSLGLRSPETAIAKSDSLVADSLKMISDKKDSAVSDSAKWAAALRKNEQADSSHKKMPAANLEKVDSLKADSSNAVMKKKKPRLSLDSLKMIEKDLMKKLGIKPEPKKVEMADSSKHAISKADSLMEMNKAIIDSINRARGFNPDSAYKKQNGLPDSGKAGVRQMHRADSTKMKKQNEPDSTGSQAVKSKSAAPAAFTGPSTEKNTDSAKIGKQPEPDRINADTVKQVINKKTRPEKAEQAESDSTGTKTKK